MLDNLSLEVNVSVVEDLTQCVMTTTDFRN